MTIEDLRKAVEEDVLKGDTIFRKLDVLYRSVSSYGQGLKSLRDSVSGLLQGAEFQPYPKLEVMVDELAIRIARAKSEMQAISRDITDIRSEYQSLSGKR